MTTPTPTPGAAPKGAQKILADAGVLLPPTGTSKSTFGLGALSSKPVFVGGLFPVNSPNPTAEDVMQSFATLRNPGTIAQIQNMLLLGGFYSSSDYQPHYGVLNAEDIAAMTKATTTAAQTGSDLSRYLSSQAKVGKFQGIAAAIANIQKQQPQEIKQIAPADLGALIDNQFKQIVGHKPDAAERAGFISAYNAMFAQMQKDRYALMSGTQGMTPEQQEAQAFYDDPILQAAAAAYETDMEIGPTPDERSEGHLLWRTKPHPPRVEAPDPSVLFEQQGPQQVMTQEAPDPSVFAENYVRNLHPTEAQSHDVANTFSMFLKLIGVG